MLYPGELTATFRAARWKTKRQLQVHDVPGLEARDDVVHHLRLSKGSLLFARICQQWDATARFTTERQAVDQSRDCSKIGGTSLQKSSAPETNCQPSLPRSYLDTSVIRAERERSQKSRAWR